MFEVLGPFVYEGNFAKLKCFIISHLYSSLSIADTLFYYLLTFAHFYLCNIAFYLRGKVARLVGDDKDSLQ